MFGFLKDKLKQAISKFTKKVKEDVEEKTKKIEKKVKKAKPTPKEKIKKEKIPEKKAKKAKAISAKPSAAIKKEIPVKEVEKESLVEQAEAEKVEEKLPEPPKEEKKVKKIKEAPKKGFFAKLFGKKEKVEEEIEKEKKEELEKEEGKEKEEPEEKKGFFKKITEVVTKTSLSEEKFESLFWDLEVILLENNVAVEVIDKIKEDMKKTLVQGKISRMNVDKTILDTLKLSIDQILTFDKIDLIKKAKDKKPLVLAFVGVNGSGKTTAIAKLVKYFTKNKLTCVVAASDTFRAAAIQQLEEHANRLNVKMIKHDYGSDPAAVAFDAVKYAESKDIDVVLIDTAGRLHSNINLMDEMKKIIRVAKPDFKIFVGESITGNDCVEQAQQFNEAIDIDGIILSKADVDEKGGAAISVSYVTKKPIIFIGTGQNYDDMKEFNKKEIIQAIGL